MNVIVRCAFLGIFFSLFSSNSMAASISYGPKSCGHAFQGMEVYLTNSANSRKKYTINILMKSANNDWSNKKSIFILMPKQKSYIGCTKGNIFPPLGMEYKVMLVENI